MTSEDANVVDTGTEVVAVAREHCTKCGVGPGKHCVYTWRSDMRPFTEDERKAVITDSDDPWLRSILTFMSDRRKDAIRRLGTPCQRPHNERIRAARNRMERLRWSVRRKPVLFASRGAIETARALQEFDRREYEQLRGWLRDHGDVISSCDDDDKVEI